MSARNQDYCKRNFTRNQDFYFLKFISNAGSINEIALLPNLYLDAISLHSVSTVDFTLSTYEIASEPEISKHSATLNANSKLMALSFSLTHNDRFSPQL